MGLDRFTTALNKDIHLLRLLFTMPAGYGSESGRKSWTCNLGRRGRLSSLPSHPLLEKIFFAPPLLEIVNDSIAFTRGSENF